MERDIIAPGDSVRLTIIFDTKSYSSRVTKTPKILVETDTLYDVYSVRITATVTPRPDTLTPIQVRPYKIDISQFNTVRDSAGFTLTNVTDDTVQLQMIAAPENILQVVHLTDIGPQEAANCAIMLTEYGISNDFAESVTFEVMGLPPIRYTIPVKRTIRDSISYPPETACVSGDMPVN